MSKNHPRAKRRKRPSAQRKQALLSGLPGGPHFVRVAEPPARAAQPEPSTGHTSRSSLDEGLEHLRLGRLSDAQACFENAVRTDDQHAVAHNCLGIVLRQQGQADRAANCFQTSLRLRTPFPEAENNLGNALRDQGQIREASACYRRAIEAKPQFAEAHNNLGVCLLVQQQIADAASSFRRALQWRPDYSEAHNNLGNALREMGELDSAAEAYQTALQIAPQAEVHNNLANVWRELGQLTLAERHYQEALRLAPDSADAHNNLATVFVDQGRLPDALAHYRRAVDLEPSSTEFLNNLANAYRQQGDMESALGAYNRIATLAPMDSWLAVRMSSLCPVTFASRDAMESHRRHSLVQWRQLAQTARVIDLARLDRVATEPSFNFQFFDGNARDFREAYAAVFSTSIPPGRCHRGTGKPRVGVFVARKHEGIFLKSLRGIIERISTSEYDVSIICPRALETRIRDNIHRDALELICIPERLDLAADAIRDARLDVLYYWEIGTDVANYFLPFLRLAPVQCTSWGIQVTSGIGQIDYYLSSELVEPDNGQDHYTEALLRADTLLTYQYPIAVPDLLEDRRDFGLNDRQHVYLCAQQIGKFHPDFDNLLAGILRRDEKGVVVITDDRYGNGSRLLVPRFQQDIPDVVPRIHLVPHQPLAGYLNLVRNADVLLDPPHFGGVNSTYDGLAMGKAIVTWPSGYHRGRYTLGCYRKMGILDMVADGAAAYVEKAVHLGTDRDARSEMEHRICEARHELFEDRRAVDEFHRQLLKLVEIARTPR